jgi:multidrug efflux system membrane fusion protein
LIPGLILQPMNLPFGPTGIEKETHLMHQVRDVRKKKRATGFAAAAVLAAALTILCGCGRSSSGADARGGAGVSVSEAKAKTGKLDVYLDAIGTVTPVYTVTVTSRVVGELTEVDYTEGQIVKKGDVLAVIDPRPYAAALAQAKGQLARDQALLKNSRIDLKRYQEAFTEHAIPEQQAATAEATVEENVGIVNLDQGAVDAAQVNFDYTRIASPINGRVGLRLVDPGNIVQANGTTPLATVTQLQPITVIFTVAEDHIAEIVEQMKGGKALTVLALDRSQSKQIAEGTLLTLDNQIDTTTGTVKARATFPNLKSELFPNQFVNTRLLLKTLDNVVLVPTAAVQLNDMERFAYVVQPDGTVQPRDVKVVAAEGETSAVSGVNAGDTLVTDGFDRLQPGSKVSLREAAAPARPTGAQ